MCLVVLWIYVCIFIYVHDIQSAQISLWQHGHNTHVIIKQCALPVISYHQNGFVATRALGHLMYVMYTELLYCL